MVCAAPRSRIAGNMPAISSRALRAAAEALRAGKVVVMPTETTYGLAADATNVAAVRKINRIKGREAGKTPPLIVASFAAALRVCHLSPSLKRLARKHWPGPLTIVAPVRHDSGLSRDVIRKDGTVAVRVSSNAVARSLARRLGGAIVATSANRAGEPACTSLADFRQQIRGQKDQPDLWLEAGRLPSRAASTIVTEEKGRLVVLRRGSIRLSPEIASLRSQ